MELLDHTFFLSFFLNLYLSIFTVTHNKHPINISTLSITTRKKKSSEKKSKKSFSLCFMELYSKSNKRNIIVYIKNEIHVTFNLIDYGASKINSEKKKYKKPATCWDRKNER